MSSAKLGSPDGLQVRLESALEPDLPIVDPHHHVRDPAGGPRFLFPELLTELSGGHNIVATVAMECGDMYRADGAPEMRPVGEVEFLNGVAAMFASGKYGPARACAGIVGFADLRLGARVEPVLDALIAAGGERLRGIRASAFWHEAYADGSIALSGGAKEARALVYGGGMPPHLLLDPAFRAGYACLGSRNLSCDVSIFQSQVPDLIDLARAYPDTNIVACHFVTPLGLGPFAGKYKEMFAPWRASVLQLARCPNVFVKLEGMRWAGVAVPGYTMGSDGRFEVQPDSSEFAAAWRPYIETCTEAFGPGRCMFGSNFNGERSVCSYVNMWNAYKRATVGYSASERADLFSGTAARFYRLSIPK